MKRVKDAMNKKVVYFSPEDSVFDVAKILAELDISGGPVVEKGKVVGVITLSDILRYLTVNVVEPKVVNPSLTEILLTLLKLGKNQAEFRKEMEKLKSWKVKDVMSRNVVTIHQNSDLVEAATLMEKHKVNRLPVVDKKGRLVGIIARADLVKAIVYES